MRTKELLDYYSRSDVQEAMVSFGKNREVVGRRLRGDYNKRPDVLVYPGDVLRQAEGGTTSFHGSVELWRNPMLISVEQRPEEVAENRIGWDFLIDLDSSNLEHTKIAADLLLKAFSAHGLKEVPVKFSGRSGFHLMVPFRLFPRELGGREMRGLFPEVPRALAGYLQEFIRERFVEEVVALEGSRAQFAKSVGKPIGELLNAGKKEIDPFKSVKIDSILISSRHLVRMPYAFNEKSWLVSVPLKHSEVRKFSAESARPENVGRVERFEGGKGSAADLLEAAMIFQRKMKRGEEDAFRERMSSASGASEGQKYGKLPEQAFPPCVQLILSQQAVDDGRKRRLFILQSFLQRAGYQVPEISEIAIRWNNSLKNPLQSVYVQSQLNHLAKQKKVLMPPNCASDGFYKELGICQPDRFCEGVKNPITSAIRKRVFQRKLERPPEQPKRRAGKRTPKDGPKR